MPVLPYNNFNSHATITDSGVILPEIDPLIFDTLFLQKLMLQEILYHQPAMSHLTGKADNMKTSQHRVDLNHNDNGLSPYNYANSSTDNIIDQLIRQIQDGGNEFNFYLNTIQLVVIGYP